MKDKKILWVLVSDKADFKVEFNCNFIESYFLKRLMKKKNIIMLPKHKLRGRKYNICIVDEII